jgi:hypothetical protein
MAQGDKAFDRKDFTTALQAYSSANAIMGVPTTGLAVARSQEHLGKLVEARDMALAVTRMPVSPREPAAFTQARTDAEKLAESLEPRIPSLVIKVTGAPLDSVQVVLDDKMLGAQLIGVPRKLDPGIHGVSASATGFRSVTVEVTLSEGAKETATLTLVPTERTAPASAAATAIATAPAADDTGGKGGLSPLVYVGFGVGGAGLIVGSITGLLSLSKASAAKEHCTGNLCQPEAQDDIDSSKLLANVANVGFGVAVVGVGLGVVGLFTSGGSAPASTTTGFHLEPVVGHRFIGARGRF